MVRADEKFANLGAAFMGGDILATQYNLVKWYWFCEHWSKISLGISKQKTPKNYLKLFWFEF